MQRLEERGCLALEQSHIGEELDYTHRNSFRLGRSNDRAYRQVRADEWTWLRHDQVVLEQFGNRGGIPG